MEVLQTYDGNYYIYGGYAMNIVAGKKPRTNTNLNIGTNRPFKLISHFRKYYPHMKVDKVKLLGDHDVYRLFKTSNNKNSFVHIKYNRNSRKVPRYKKIYADRQTLKNKKLLINRSGNLANFIYTFFGGPPRLANTVKKYVTSTTRRNKKDYYNSILTAVNTYKQGLEEAERRRLKFIKTLQRYKSL